VFSGKDFSILFCIGPGESSRPPIIRMCSLLLCVKPFSEKTRCVRSVVVVCYTSRKPLIYHVTQNFYLIFCVCLPPCPSIKFDTLRAKCVHVQQEMSSFRRNGYDIILHRLAVLGENQDEGAVCDTIRSDRILFYTFRVFSRNRHEFLTTVNAPGRSYCCRYIHIIAVHNLYRSPLGCTKESIFMGFYYTTLTTYAFILFSGNLSSDNIRVFNWIRSRYNISDSREKKPPLHSF